MTFCLYRSNRVERLAEALVGVVREPLASPFARECIVVQGPGMERWLSALLADELSIWANPWFPFPRAVIELALDAALGEVPEDARVFHPEGLGFVIARSLPALLADPAFRDVAAYLRDDRAHERLLSLSSLFAATFDQYLVYRPDLILSWERGAGDHFQARLWRAITSGLPRTHIAARIEGFMQALDRGEPLTRGATQLPSRISMFGISTLPPAFLNVLSRLSSHVDVHLFLLTPSPEYWGDFDKRSERGASTRSLLASLGKVSREFIDLLSDVPHVEPYPDLFEAPTARGLLPQLQRDLMELAARARGGAEELPPVAVRASDNSLGVHVCHSAVRELEVLRDQLRARFEADPSLEPRDVVVFAPNIERYAPAIEAVFSERGDAGKAAIPYRIADRRASRASELYEAFFALLELVQSRLSLSDVLDLLHRTPVRARFAIEENEIDRLQSWLVDAGARWSRDAVHRASFGQPGYEQNSFRFALDRLFLGYASADHERRSLRDVLPFSDVEGREAELLGRLSRFAESLFAQVGELAAPRPVEAWSAALAVALGAMLSDDDELGYEHHGLRKALAELAEDARRAGFAEPVSLAATQHALEARVDRGRANLGFLSAGVTFCEHVPMRAIPFRIVGLIGMDDESFPRRSARTSFDLMASEARPGDRALRDDDRQLFLEALLSARDALIVTYVGRSAKDDGPRPASVLVDQLLRVIDRQFVLTGDDDSMCLAFEESETSVAAAVTALHALHRFDARYFRPRPKSRYFSYDATAALAARARLAPARSLPVFVKGPLARQEDDEQVELESLVQFFRAPQRAFMQQRLRVSLPRELDEVPDREPTALDALDRYRLGDALLREHADRSPAEALRILRQEGGLPPGTPAALVLEDIEEDVRAIRSAYDAGTRLPDRSFAIPLSGATLVGRLNDLHALARVELTVAQLRDKHKLSAWIRHLALCASGDAPARSVLIGRGKEDAEVLVFARVDEALARLDELVALYRLGLRMPLPLVLDPASNYLDDLGKGVDPATALEKASLKVLPSAHERQRGGDRDSAYLRQVWSQEQLEALESLRASDGSRSVSFAEACEIVLGPMRRHLAGGAE